MKAICVDKHVMRVLRDTLYMRIYIYRYCYRVCCVFEMNAQQGWRGEMVDNLNNVVKEQGNNLRYTPSCTDNRSRAL